MSNTEFVAKNGLVVGGNTRMTVAVGNTAQRPSAPRPGDFRFNTDLGQFEGFQGGAFLAFGFSNSSTNGVLTSLLIANSSGNVYVTPLSVAVSDPNGTSLVNSTAVVASNSTAFTTQTPAGLQVGSNVVVNSSGFGLGNSTVSFVVNSTSLRLGNATSFWSMNAGTLSGNAVSATSYSGTGIATASQYWGSVIGKVVTTDTLNLSGAYVPLTDGPTIAWDMTGGINFSVTLGGNRTLANPTGMIVGRSGLLQVNMDSVGGRTLSFGSQYFFDSDTAPVIGTGANKMNFLNWHCFAANSILITMAAKAV
jgi:hypothetical protein